MPKKGCSRFSLANSTNTRTRSCARSKRGLRIVYAILQNTLQNRKRQEVDNITAVLNELARAIEEELKTGPKPEQLDLFNDAERTQLRRDVEALKARLARLPDEKEQEVQRHPSPISGLCRPHLPGCSGVPRSGIHSAKGKPMTNFSRHGEWLSLIDVSGPFLAEPVLKQTFPQGLEQTDPLTRKHVRKAYDEWREAIDADDPDSAPIHDAWIELVLKKVLELDENGEEDVLKPKGALPESIAVSIPEHEVTLHPDYAVVNGQDDGLPLMFVTVYPPDTDLSARVKGDSWAASPVERMVELCRARDVRLGLVTDGERWTLVDAPIGGVTSNASWYARLWGQEPITLQAFVNLLGIRRFFVDDSERLPSLLDESLKLQEEVTDALGEQVRRAVEVLVQRLDRADLDLNRELLVGVEPTEIYEAALTVMMRIVFLLSAEERGLLLLDDEAYQTNYAVSTLAHAASGRIRGNPRTTAGRLVAVARDLSGRVRRHRTRGAETARTRRITVRSRPLPLPGGSHEGHHMEGAPGCSATD